MIKPAYSQKQKGNRRPCPECGKLSSEKDFPFCSARCQAIDLNRWLSGSYVLPGKPIYNDKD